eukprot:CAMPEP_0171040542 /NCGR_PEP_ID=MMETSP0736-20130129/44766_1 /TAXON_ID=186038 /ORGANISM="Fragilariopsis kerguelensis, Strain L26-C5" /LENGTH=313 /DNA_ID=CAMNT_0011487941 /DNA_START=180 /DNA_END=1122 /DNA_ORIENTATION=+
MTMIGMKVVENDACNDDSTTTNVTCNSNSTSTSSKNEIKSNTNDNLTIIVSPLSSLQVANHNPSLSDEEVPTEDDPSKNADHNPSLSDEEVPSEDDPSQEGNVSVNVSYGVSAEVSEDDNVISEIAVPTSEEVVATTKILTKTRSKSETLSNENNSNRRRSRLRFSTLTIREYPRILGDNVTVMGPPISISWEHDVESVYELEDYEDACKYTRRTQAELKMPSRYRDEILRGYGYTRKEIQGACKKSTIARNQRKRTIETIRLQPLEELFEKAVKKTGLRPLLRVGRNSKSGASLSHASSISNFNKLHKRKTI